MKALTKILIVTGVVVALTLLTPSRSMAEEFIKDVEEGGTPKLIAYKDSGGKWTIGFGSTWHRDLNREVRGGDNINSEQAYRWLREDIAERKKIILSVVRVPLNANQLDSLISFAYNVGIPAFKSSTLLKKLNAGIDKHTVAKEFDKWVYDNGVYVQGLANRRAKEKKLFLS